MPDHTALLHPGGRGDDEPCHLPARARTRAVERGVRRAVCPPRVILRLTLKESLSHDPIFS